MTIFSASWINCNCLLQLKKNMIKWWGQRAERRFQKIKIGKLKNILGRGYKSGYHFLENKGLKNHFSKRQYQYLGSKSINFCKFCLQKPKLLLLLIHDLLNYWSLTNWLHHSCEIKVDKYIQMIKMLWYQTNIGQSFRGILFPTIWDKCKHSCFLLWKKCS